MPVTVKRSLAAILGVALVAGSVQPVLAGPPGGCPPGLAKKGACGNSGGGSAAGAYDQGYRDGARDARRWHRGAHVPRDRYLVVDDWRSRGWHAPPPGHVYVRIDGEILLIAAATGLVVDLLLH